MSAHNQSYNARLALSTGDAVACGGAGASRTTFPRNGLYFYAIAGATATELTCPDPANLPRGLSCVIDNTNGADTFTLNPDNGTSVTVATGAVAIVIVAASGVFKQFNNA